MPEFLEPSWLSRCWFLFEDLIVLSRFVFDPAGGGRRESAGSADLLLPALTGIEQDTRVLTLAEQIIAAIPDRIKVWNMINICLKKTES